MIKVQHDNMMTRPH